MDIKDDLLIECLQLHDLKFSKKWDTNKFTKFSLYLDSLGKDNIKIIKKCIILLDIIYQIQDVYLRLVSGEYFIFHKLSSNYSILRNMPSEEQIVHIHSFLQNDYILTPRERKILKIRALNEQRDEEEEMLKKLNRILKEIDDLKRNTAPQLLLGFKITLKNYLKTF
jgi:hypothetical protein